MKPISADWQQWIQTNLQRGCDKDVIARILFDNGFDPVAIITAMRYVPQSAELVAAMNARLGSVVSHDDAAARAAWRTIDDVKLPRARRVVNDKAHFYLLDDFLTAEECERLIELIEAQHQPSTTTQPDDPDRYFRTSKTSNLSLLGDAFVDAIDRRIAEYMGFEPERAEGIQGQYYDVGDEFKPHTDYFQPDTEEYHRYAGERGQRTWTFMIYLNDVEAGGQTEFPQLGIEVTPQRGMAVIWNSLHADGTVNADTLHWAKPVIRGRKFVITKWFRAYGSLRYPFPTRTG